MAALRSSELLTAEGTSSASYTQRWFNSTEFCKTIWGTIKRYNGIGAGICEMIFAMNPVAFTLWNTRINII